MGLSLHLPKYKEDVPRIVSEDLKDKIILSPADCSIVYIFS